MEHNIIEKTKGINKVLQIKKLVKTFLIIEIYLQIKGVHEREKKNNKLNDFQA